MAFRVMLAAMTAVFVLAAPASAAHAKPTPRTDDSAGAVVGLIIVYFIPALIAAVRRHRSAVSIIVVNVLFGWTIIGWFVAVIWSISASENGSARAMHLQPEDDRPIGRLVPVDIPNVIAQNGETFYWGITNAEALGEIHHREYQKGYGGASVRVMRGVTLHSGGSRGHMVDRVVFGVVDVGALVFSNTRLLFIGARGTAFVGYQRIVKIDPFVDGFRVHSDQVAPMTFRTGSQREAVVLRRLIAGDYGDPPAAELKVLS